MRSLKIKDIKKFTEKATGTSFVGAVINKNENGIMLLNLEGHERFFEFSRNELTYSSTHLDSKVRSQLERVVDEASQYFLKKEEIKKLESECAKHLDNARKETETLQAVQGRIKSSEVLKVFNKYLQKYYPKLYLELKSLYRVNVMQLPWMCGLDIDISRYVVINRDAKVGNYDFLGMDGDGFLYIKDNKTKSYKELYNKYASKDIKFTIDNLQGRFKREKTVDVNPENTLYYSDSMSIFIPDNCFTEAYIEKLVKTIKIK